MSTDLRWPIIFSSGLMLLGGLMCAPFVGSGDTNGREGHKAEDRKVLLVYSESEYGGFSPRNEFDRDFAALNLSAQKRSLSQLGQEPLQKYDLVIFSSMTLRKGSNDANLGRSDELHINRCGALIKERLNAGGAVLFTDISEATGYYSLTHISPELGLNAANCATGMVGDFVTTSLTTSPHLLPGHEVAYDPRAICRRLGGTYTWAHFTNLAKGWRVIATCPDKKPVLITRRIGAGLLLATTLAAGRGIDAHFLENLLFYSRKQRGDPIPLAEAKLEAPERRQVYKRNPSFFDAQGNIIVNGKPFFPLGFYLVRPGSYPILAANGFNLVWGIHDLKEAEKRGIRGVQVNSWDNEITKKQLLQEKTNPVKIAQCLVEEPGNLPVPPFDSPHTKKMNALVKSINPNVPTTVMVNNPLEFPSFGGIGDFGTCDPYCFSAADSPALRPGRDIDLLRRLAASDNYPVWVLLQTHWFGSRERNQTWMVKPTADQVVAETYVSLAHRANGILYFLFDEVVDKSITYIHHDDGSFDEPLWTTLRQLAKEVETLRPALLSPLPRQTAKVMSAKSEMEYLLRRADKQLYLLAVNPMPYPVEAEVKLGADVEASRVRLLFGSRVITAKNGTFRYRFASYQREVFVYRAA